MSGWPLLFLSAPAALATVLLLVLPGPQRLRRRGLLLGVCAAVALLGAALMLWSARPTSSRVVFVLDDEGLIGGGQAALEEIVERYAAAGMESCDVLVLRDGAPEDCAPTAFGARAWRAPAACARIDAGDALSAREPDCALRIATHRLAGDGWLARTFDTLRARDLRIAVVASQPKKLAQRWVLDAQAALAQVAPSGVSVDLVHAGDAQAREETPTLTLRLSPPRFPERHVEGTVELQLTSPALDAVQVGPLKARTHCEIDAGEGTGLRFDAPDDEYVVEAAGTALRAHPTRLGDFKGAAPGQTPYGLVLGFHLLECKVTLRLASGRELSASGARYLDVGPRYFLVVAGRAGAFAHDDSTLTQENDIAALWEPGAARAGGEVVFGGMVPEATFSTTGLPGDARPSLLVLHDLQAATWRARCADLKRWVASGMTLLVSGAPHEADCSFLPAHASPVQVDRRPRVTFLLDPSRLGNLTHRPQANTESFVPYLPVPTSAYGSPAPLAEGLAVQREAAGVICERLRTLDRAIDCTQSSTPPGKRALYLQAKTGPAPFPPAAVSAASESQLLQQSQLEARLQELLAGGRPQDVVGVNDVLVLFTYEVHQLAGARETLEALLDRGVLIVVVSLATPYATALRASNTTGLTSLFSLSRAGAAARLGPGVPAASVFSPSSLEGRLLQEAGWRIDLAGPAPLESARQVGAAVGATLQARLAPEASIVALHRRGRFVDERLGPFVAEAQEPGWQTTPAGAFAAPLRFQVLSAGPLAAQASWFSAIAAPEVKAGSPKPLPLAIGGVVGRGEVLVLGYSLFEGLSGSFFPGAPWRGRGTQRVMMPGDAGDGWGPRRIVDAAAFQAALEQGPGEEPRIVNATVVDRSGRIELEVVQRLHAGQGVERLELRACRTGAFSGTCRPPEGAAAISGRVIGLDAAAQRLTYSFSPSELREVCRGPAGCIATLLRQGAQVGAPEEGVRLFVRAATSSASGALADVPVLEQLRLLALYSGGAEVRSGAAPPRSLQPVRPLLVRTLLLLFLAYWGLRFSQRLRTERALQLATVRQLDLLSSTDSRGAVNSAGEALGRAQAALRVGAFAGFRSFQGGDRLSSAVREDVWLYARQRAVGGLARIPRVSRHIEEVGRHVRLLVNVGMSLRFPQRRGRGSAKLHGAAVVCDLLAEVCWHFRSTVEVVPVGLEKAGETLGPLASAGARGEIAAHVLAQGRRPAHWITHYPLPEVERPMSVILVSDFLNEELSSVARFAANVEEEGGLFGAIQVYSSSELQLLGSGVSPAHDLLCDRTVWSQEDARRAYRQLSAELDLALGDYAGGLLPVASGQPSSEVLSALSERSMLTLLR